jgi:hypothetical protein
VAKERLVVSVSETAAWGFGRRRLTEAGVGTEYTVCEMSPARLSFVIENNALVSLMTVLANPGPLSPACRKATSSLFPQGARPEFILVQPLYVGVTHLKPRDATDGALDAILVRKVDWLNRYGLAAGSVPPR